MEIKLVEYNDINTCIEFVEIVKEDFAGYEKEGFKKALENCIKHREAISAMNEAGNIIGLSSLRYILKPDKKERQDP